MAVRIKICGLDRAEALDAAVAAGADMVGFVFFPKSPRDIGLDAAAALCARVPEGVERVGLLVDPDDALLDRVLSTVALDVIQLHGKEPPARVQAVRARAGLPVMKALGIATADDLAAAADYEDVADRLLLDAKAPPGADRPGGNAAAFDWTLLRKGRRPRRPWLLAGGLTPANAAEAVRVADAPGIDVSSGVESAPGRKDSEKIRGLVAAIRAAG